MLDRSSALARTLGQPLCLLLTLASTDCSKKTPAGGADAGPDAGSASGLLGAGSARQPKACKSPGKGTAFTLGTETAPRDPSPAGSSDEANLDDEELPFAVLLGNAVVENGEFWVTGLDQRRGATHAVWARISASVDRGKVIDLGRVYGDAEPPRVATGSGGGFLVVPDTDPGGRVLKLARLSSKAMDVEWLERVNCGRDESAAFSVAAQGESAVVAWDEDDTVRRLGAVRWRAFGAKPTRESAVGVGAKRGPANAEAADFRSRIEVDAEGPQLVARPGGFWLAYLAGEAQKSAPNAGRTVAAASSTAPQPLEDRAVVELGRRAIELLALDARGNVSGRAITVTEPSAQVETFDIKATASGGALIAYREARQMPGIEEERAFLLEVRPDGGVERRIVEDERIGAGVPLLMMPEDAASPVWIGIAGKSGDMSVLTYRPEAGRLGQLIDEPALRGVEPVARDGNALLLARPRGTVVEFERVECDFKDAP